MEYTPLINGNTDLFFATKYEHKELNIYLKHNSEDFIQVKVSEFFNDSYLTAAIFEDNLNEVLNLLNNEDYKIFKIKVFIDKAYCLSKLNMVGKDYINHYIIPRAILSADIIQEIFKFSGMTGLGKFMSKEHLKLAKLQNKNLTVDDVTSLGVGILAEFYYNIPHEHLCEKVASHGDLLSLKWLRAQDPPCPWNGKTITNAIKANYPEVAKWAKDNGCLAFDEAFVRNLETRICELNQTHKNQFINGQKYFDISNFDIQRKRGLLISTDTNANRVKVFENEYCDMHMFNELDELRVVDGNINRRCELVSQIVISSLRTQVQMLPIQGQNPTEIQLQFSEKVSKFISLFGR